MKDTLKGLKRQSVFLIIMAFLVIGVLVSYALVSYNIILTGDKVNEISTCSLDINVADTNPVTLLSSVPISDNAIDSYTPYTLTVRNKNSECTSISFTLKMTDFCLSCAQTNGVCTLGSNSCNCNSGYKIDGNLIKYQVVNNKTGEVINGVDPYTNINISGSLASATDTVTYSIKMWIASTATNSDLYVSDGATGYLTNADGSYVTKNFCSKIKLEVNAF